MEHRIPAQRDAALQMRESIHEKKENECKEGGCNWVNRHAGDGEETGALCVHFLFALNLPCFAELCCAENDTIY